jgi:DNA-binding response OmpR family regulator
MAPSLNILVVEDHDDLREATVSALSDCGHQVRGVASAEDLDDELAGVAPDVVLLDLNLPGEDGLSVARRLRQSIPAIGIIMVTARDQIADITRGYASGADIYVTKPVSPEELAAAVSAIARRVRPGMVEPDELSLSASSLVLQGPHGSVDVSDVECKLLLALSKAPGRRLETWQIMESTGRPMDDAGKKSLEVQIVRLRKKLENAGAASPTIKSIRSFGYQLCVPVTVRP